MGIKRNVIGIVMVMLALNMGWAQDKMVQEIKELSKQKWQWMADKDVKELDQL